MQGDYWLLSSSQHKSMALSYTRKLLNSKNTHTPALNLVLNILQILLPTTIVFFYLETKSWY